MLLADLQFQFQPATTAIQKVFHLLLVVSNTETILMPAVLLLKCMSHVVKCVNVVLSEGPKRYIQLLLRPYDVFSI
jgi:hypothetical protein